MKYVVELCDLQKKYSSHQVLAGINLALEPGKILGLFGPNGSGKSTLLKILAGITPPSSGTVRICGQKPSVKTKALIAYLPEKNQLYDGMTVGESLSFVSSFYHDWHPQKASELIERFAIDVGKKLAHLSKGQLSCLKLLLCLARNTPLLLLDEPFSGIDLMSRQAIIDAILDTYRMGEQSIIITTHEIGEAESIFDEVAYIKEGRVTLSGPADELRQTFHASLEELWESSYRQ